LQKLQGSRFVIPAKAGIQGEQRKEHHLGPLISLSSKDEKPWTFKAGKIAVDKYQITWEDRFLSEPATLSIQDLALKAENFSTVPGQKAKASLGFRLKEIGNVAIDGSVGMNPPGADLKVALKGIAIKADSLTGC